MIREWRVTMCSWRRERETHCCLSQLWSMYPATMSTGKCTHVFVCVCVCVCVDQQCGERPSLLKMSKSSTGWRPVVSRCPYTFVHVVYLRSVKLVSQTVHLATVGSLSNKCIDPEFESVWSHAMRWSRQPRRCRTGEKRERGRGRNNSAAAANAARFCEHDDSIDPSFLGTSACLSIQDCITMHHSHTHTYKKRSTSACWIQHIVFFSCFQSEPHTPDSTAASSVLFKWIKDTSH